MQKKILILIAALVVGYFLWPDGDEPPAEKPVSGKSLPTGKLPARVQRPGQHNAAPYGSGSPWSQPRPQAAVPYAQSPYPSAPSFRPPEGSPQGYGSYSSAPGYRFRPQSGDVETSTSQRYTGGYPAYTPPQQRVPSDFAPTPAQQWTEQPQIQPSMPPAYTAPGGYYIQ